MRNRREGERTPEPEKDLEGRFADAVVAVSRGGGNRGLTNFRIYDLPKTRIAALHAPQVPSFSAYFKPLNGLEIVHFRLDKHDPNDANHKITKITNSNNGDSLEFDLDLDASLEALKALPDQDDPHELEFNDEERNGIMQAFGIEIPDEPSEEAKRWGEKAGRAFKNFSVARELGLMDAEPDQVKTVIELLAMLQRAEKVGRLARRKIHREIEGRIPEVHDFAA